MKLLISFVTFMLLAKVSLAMDIDDERLCKSAIATIMSKDISIIDIYNKKGDVFYLSYIRASDNSTWKFKCKIEGNKIIWGNPDGRWRLHPLDSKVTYEIKNNSLIVREAHSDGTNTIREFK